MEHGTSQIRVDEARKQDAKMLLHFPYHTAADTGPLNGLQRKKYIKSFHPTK
jgi:hypothetical protein